MGKMATRINGQIDDKHTAEANDDTKKLTRWIENEGGRRDRTHILSRVPEVALISSQQQNNLAVEHGNDWKKRFKGFALACSATSEEGTVLFLLSPPILVRSFLLGKASSIFLRIERTARSSNGHNALATSFNKN
jgi:hypothetical protein